MEIIWYLENNSFSASKLATCVLIPGFLIATMVEQYVQKEILKVNDKDVKYSWIKT